VSIPPPVEPDGRLTPSVDSHRLSCRLTPADRSPPPPATSTARLAASTIWWY